MLVTKKLIFKIQALKKYIPNSKTKIVIKPIIYIDCIFKLGIFMYSIPFIYFELLVILQKLCCFNFLISENHICFHYFFYFILIILINRIKLLLMEKWDFE